MKILTGARSSKLSRAQVAEIKEELFRIRPDVELEPVWADSPGDRDKETSLRNLPKNDFFTRDLDEMLRAGKVRIAVHSAKDLPDPIPKGLSLIALTRGQDPRDSLVMRTGESFERLKPDARIATSSSRREEIVKELRDDLLFIDLRGTIEERLKKLETGEADAVVVAEAALIRLKLTGLNRMILPKETAPLQGRLAVLARAGDEEMEQLFHALNAS